MVPWVLWAIPRGTMRAVGCGTWSGVRDGRPPFFLLFALSKYAGTYPECSGISIEPRKVATVALTLLQRAAEGLCIVGRVPTCVAGGQGYAMCPVPFLVLSLVPSQ